MGQHTKKKSPTPTGMKLFVGAIAGLTVAFMTVGVVSHTHHGSDPAKPKPVMTTTTEKTAVSPKPPGKPTSPTPVESRFFLNCQVAKEEGALPLKKGDPGYRLDLDMDRDGTACEGV